MWIFTRKGFVSAVLHKDDPETMVVRARAQEHLEALFPTVNIISLKRADYPHRVHIPREDFIMWATLQAEDIDYPDFKSSLEDHDYHHVCSKIWLIAHDLEH